jgi:hypothetical protein
LKEIVVSDVRGCWLHVGAVDLLQVDNHEIFALAETFDGAQLQHMMAVIGQDLGPLRRHPATADARNGILDQPGPRVAVDRAAWGVDSGRGTLPPFIKDLYRYRRNWGVDLLQPITAEGGEIREIDAPVRVEIEVGRRTGTGVGGGPPIRGEAREILEIDRGIVVELSRRNVREGECLEQHIGAG